jgi:hypothetical protein
MPRPSQLWDRNPDWLGARRRTEMAQAATPAAPFCARGILCMPDLPAHLPHPLLQLAGLLLCALQVRADRGPVLSPALDTLQLA